MRSMQFLAIALAFDHTVHHLEPGKLRGVYSIACLKALEQDPNSDCARSAPQEPLNRRKASTATGSLERMGFQFRTP